MEMAPPEREGAQHPECRGLGPEHEALLRASSPLAPQRDVRGKKGAHECRGGQRGSGQLPANEPGRRGEAERDGDRHAPLVGELESHDFMPRESEVAHPTRGCAPPVCASRAQPPGPVRYPVAGWEALRISALENRLAAP